MKLTGIRPVCAAALVLGISLRIAGAHPEADVAESNPDAAEKEQLNAARAQMTARWTKLQAFCRIDGEVREVDRVPEPILSFSESTRDTGHLGTLWIWGTTGRPVAIFSQSKAYGKPVWGFELAALSEGVSVVMPDGWEWSPESALEMTPFTTEQRVADNQVERLRLAKNLARRFTVLEDYFDESIELRLLPRPAYRYQDEDAGLIEGSLFIFAHGTNPEVVAVIECHQQTSGPVWSYGFLPLAGAGVTAELNNIVVWKKESTRVSKAQDVYSTWLETVEE